MGVRVKEENGGILIESNRKKLKPVDIKTLPAPGFPTDMQPQFTALLASINGEKISFKFAVRRRIRFYFSS